MIEFDNITFIYDNKPLMQHFSCCISSGEKVVLYGPSGHGKSTLLASVAGFVLPDKGSIRINGKIPDTAATLNSNKGICYDLASLFAAMCRSQNIPCTLTKGYAGSSYHAWNKVNVSGNWYQIDMTYAVTKRVINETTFAGCVSPLTYSQQSDTLAVSAVA